jgi:hypothetical protein
MVTIDNLDFSRLKPYDGKTAKCFEQLWYQIVRKEFSALGTVTPIDGSGGDGGVEFYLKLNNGEKWGWQCKFFGDSGRLNASSRDISIENSLQTACRNHPEVTKWFLCLKTDLTPNSISSAGKFSKGEIYWFEKELPKVIPTGMSVELEHWGVSKLISFLNEVKHIGIRTLFFGQLEFDQAWFTKRFEENFQKVRDKYDPELHTIDRYCQALINCSLFDPTFCTDLITLKNELDKQVRELNMKIGELEKNQAIDGGRTQIENFINGVHEFKAHFDLVTNRISLIESAFKEYDSAALSAFRLEELNDDFHLKMEKVDTSIFKERTSHHEKALAISSALSDFGETYNRFFFNYYGRFDRELRFLGDASKGKTHVSCDIAFKAIHRSRPAIFIVGEKFTNESSITDTIRKILDVGPQYSLEEFLAALDTYAGIVKSRLPVIIDGLNETTFNKGFSPIWRNHLESFAAKVLSFENLVLITTVRSSYAKQIWVNHDNSKTHYINGFEDYETIHEAIGKYFKRYKIKCDFSFAPVEKFRDPIFLRIFCEIKNPGWKLDGEVAVNIDDDSTYDVLEEYIRQVNQRITSSNDLFVSGDQFVSTSLKSIADCLWENNEREVLIQEYYQLIDGEGKYTKDTSKAEVLLHEGMLITRDMRDGIEYVSFTYDVLAGYMITRSLVQDNQNPKYFVSTKFIDKIFQGSNAHPLYEDVLASLCLVLPQRKNVTIHALIFGDVYFRLASAKWLRHFPWLRKTVFKKTVQFASYSLDVSFRSLFSLSAKHIKEEDIRLVQSAFLSHPRREEKINLFLKTLGDGTHPLGAGLLYKLLAMLPVHERDLTWTEHVRKNYYNYQPFVIEFEINCKASEKESAISAHKLHTLSRFIVWMLTSTNRNLRDLVTRALYYYGRKFPSEYSKLVYESLAINDPYVWERTLAALYGVAMAEHNSFSSNDFREQTLPEIAKKIYVLMFKQDAIHATTHLLARDYAKRIIDLALIHQPDLISEEEQKLIIPPYKSGGLRDWGEYNYGDSPYGYSKPIQMDFSNYTLGHLVEGGGAYADPPEKKKVRRQVYWRINQLGWTENRFRDAERGVSNDLYYNSRGERPKVERYGKKYSWIAYFEIAGMRSDQGLLKNESNRFRISDADIDPSFPIPVEDKKFIQDDLLGDRGVALQDWLQSGGMPHIENYLHVFDINGNKGEWICLDGYVCQEDKDIARRRFVFIRPFLIKEENYAPILDLFLKHQFEGRRIVEKNGNYYTFAGELYCCPDSTISNHCDFEFSLGPIKAKIMSNEEGFLLRAYHHYKALGIPVPAELPEEIEYDTTASTVGEVLIPAMEYSWEGYHSTVNEAGGTTVVAKEMANYLGLVDRPQTFNLFERSGNLASISLSHYVDFNDSESSLYIRRDLLEKYLADNKMKMVWTIWGEREASFNNNVTESLFYKTQPFPGPHVFQKIVEFPKRVQ